jgi:transcriptional antiterminator RfaH
MRWYCIHTKPRREPQAAAQLSDFLGCEVYFPQFPQHRRIRRVARVVQEPLFPNYLFARFDLEKDYRAVRYSRDVLDIVRSGQSPAVLSDELISELRTFASHAEDLKSPAALHSGDRVEINKGPMQGLEAIILSAPDENDRVAILLSILGCGARFTISRDEISKQE